MIDVVARRIAGGLVKKQVIEHEYYPVFHYATHCLLSTILLIGLTFLIGLLFGRTVECICLVFPIALLRKYGGGYHCKREGACVIASTCTIILGMFVFALGWMEKAITFWNAVAVISLIVLSPVDTNERPIEPEERKELKTKVVAILTGFEILVIVFLRNKWTMHATHIMGGIVIVALVQWMGFINQKKGSKCDSKRP